MPKIKPEDLEKIAEQTSGTMSLRDGGSRAKTTVHMGTCGIAAGAERIKNTLTALVEQEQATDIVFTTSGCAGLCSREPMMTVELKGQTPVKYVDLDEAKTRKIFSDHVLSGEAVEEYALDASDIGFFDKQRLIALRNRGMIDPDQIDQYIAQGGYTALAKALTDMTPEQIIEQIKISELRGRGGAGFPTGRKWELTRSAKGNGKHIVCNADEGDPGAYMDRNIIESDPHSVLEGMMIGARAIGASHGHIYIRNEYPLARKRLITAIRQATDYGLLGQDIFGTDFNLDISIHRGAGAFVCGEETSLIGSLEGKPPEPKIRPPFPAESGIRDAPTNINNVETWANVPEIINRGGEWFSNIGTKSSKGTKVFSVVGKVKNNGLVEVPMGITLREIVYDIGGGIADDKKFKAVQTGGPSGGCIPVSLLDLPIDYEKLAEVGSIMGSGGMIVMDEDTCMVDVAKYFLEFLKDESCGKCTACREGINVMHGILVRICEGDGVEADIEQLEELAEAVKDASLCALGGTAPNPVLSTLRYFRDEYESHIKDKSCPAGVCKALITYDIDQEKCKGCRLCAKNCPQEAITGEAKEPHTIDLDKCIKCGVCIDVCKFEAVSVT